MPKSYLQEYPGQLRLPDFRPLADGRWQMADYRQFPAPKWDTPAYGSLHPFDGDLPTDEQTRWGGLRLISIDPGTVPGKPSVPGLIYLYEQIHATNETQVGKLRRITDENGREVVQAQFIQFSSASYVKGTVGVTAAPGLSSAVLAREEMDDAGILRRITRTYNQVNADAATADGLGPFIPAWPFHNVGDPDHVVISQTGEQPATHYKPPPLNTTQLVTVNGSSSTLYFVGDITPPGRTGASLVRFTRRWANKPGTRSEWGTIAASFPGLKRTQAEYNAAGQPNLRSGFSKVVICRIDYAYYRIAPSGGDYTSPDDIPLIAETVYRKASQGANERLSPFEVYLSDVNTVSPLSASVPVSNFFVWSDLLTVPTRTQYFALGSYGVVLECRIRRYMGPFYERRTVRVSPI